MRRDRVNLTPTRLEEKQHSGAGRLPKLDFILQAVTEERGLLAITSRVLLARGPGKVYFLLAGKGAPEDEEADDDGD